MDSNQFYSIAADAALPVIEKLLTGKTFAMGGQYTVVDPFFLVFYRWGNRIGIPMKDRYPIWTKHAQRVASRPTVKRVFEAEGITIDGVA